MVVGRREICKRKREERKRKKDSRKSVKIEGKERKRREGWGIQEARVEYKQVAGWRRRTTVRREGEDGRARVDSF